MEGTKEKKCVIYFVHVYTSKKKFKTKSLRRHESKTGGKRREKKVRRDRYSFINYKISHNNKSNNYCIIIKA